MQRIKGATKVREHRGTGEGASYIPWIKTREISSTGTKSLINDWKHGRQIHTLSRNETNFYYILRWDDHVLDINEQYPLDRETTLRISKSLGVRHPVPANDPNERMTTDFRVKYLDESGKVKYKAYSVKDSYEQVFGNLEKPGVKRLVEKQSVEMSYWKLQGIPFKIVFGDRDINRTFAMNISVVVEYYDFQKVHTLQEFLCYLIAHKHIQTEMENKVLNIQELTKEYLGTQEQIDFWIAEITKDHSEYNAIAKMDYQIAAFRQSDEEKE